MSEILSINGRKLNQPVTKRTHKQRRAQTTPQGRGILEVIKPYAHPLGGQAPAHGTFLYLRRRMLPPCARCLVKNECPRFDAKSTRCFVAEAYAERTIAWARTFEHIQDGDLGLVLELIAVEVLLWACANALSSGDMFSDHLNRIQAGARTQKLAIVAALGLSPAGRRALGLPVRPVEQGPTLAQILAQASAPPRGVLEDGRGTPEAVAGQETALPNECER